MGDAPSSGGYLPMHFKQPGQLTPENATLTKTLPACSVGSAQLLGRKTSGPRQHYVNKFHDGWKRHGSSLIANEAVLALQLENRRACHQVRPAPNFLTFLQAKAVNDFQMIL
jgi:hypothetical protein